MLLLTDTELVTFANLWVCDLWVCGHEHPVGTSSLSNKRLISGLALDDSYKVLSLLRASVPGRAFYCRCYRSPGKCCFICMSPCVYTCPHVPSCVHTSVHEGIPCPGYVLLSGLSGPCVCLSISLASVRVLR